MVRPLLRESKCSYGLGCPSCWTFSLIIGAIVTGRSREFAGGRGNDRREGKERKRERKKEKREDLKVSIWGSNTAYIETEVNHRGCRQEPFRTEANYRLVDALKIVSSRNLEIRVKWTGCTKNGMCTCPWKGIGLVFKRHQTADLTAEYCRTSVQTFQDHPEWRSREIY